MAAEEEKEWAGHAAVPVDLRSELQDMDLINAIRLARSKQIDQVVAGITQSFWMVLTFESIRAMLHLLPHV